MSVNDNITLVVSTLNNRDNSDLDYVFLFEDCMIYNQICLDIIHTLSSNIFKAVVSKKCYMLHIKTSIYTNK